MRNRRLLGAGLAALALGLGAVPRPGTAAPRPAAAPAAVAGSVAAAAPGTATLPTAPATPAATAATSTPRPGPAGAGPARGRGRAGGAGDARGGPCAAFAGARQLPGADGITPAAWSGGGLVVPACGPAPGDGSAAGTAAPVYAYPGALWTAGYQCVEFSERYLHDRFGVTMNVATNGDQVAAHYAVNFAGLFAVVANGTPHRAPAPGDVLSLSAAPGFDSASGGHTAVVQSSSVSSAGNGTVTVVEENASAGGIAVLAVTAWTVRYPGFRYAEWLTPVARRLPAATGSAK